MSDVSTKTDSVTAMEPDWELARALLGGTRAIRKAGKTHMPQWPNETDEAYKCRLATAVLFPAYQRTIETLTGKPFSRPITRGEDIPEQIAEWLDDVDLEGRNIDAFAADIMESALGSGLAGILVDYPDTSGIERTANGSITKAVEKAAGLRPYMVQIFPTQLLGWRAKRTNGAWLLTQLRIMEAVEEEAGAFGMKEVPQVRVLEPGKWTTYRKSDVKKDEWVQHAEGQTTLDRIPFVPVYGSRKAFMVAKPPLIELAHMNVKHWQGQSDQDTILHVARVPILAASGIDDDKWQMTVGASAAVRLPTGATLGYVEHTGAAIEAGRVSLEDLKEEMRQAGAELLVIKPGKITATQTATENAVGKCALQRITQGEEDALDQALQFMADFAKLPTGGHLTIFNDFGAATLAEASMQLVLTMNISDETKFEEAKRRGIISQDKKWIDEKDRLDAQGPALGAMTSPGANG